MKNYLSVIIAAALVIIGLIGAMVCIIPTASAEYKVIDSFISAIDDCDSKAIVDCYPVDEMSSLLGSSYNDAVDKAAEGLESKGDYLEAFCSTAADLVPENAKSVESVELVSCSKSKAQSNGYFEGNTASAVIKVEYKTAEDETASFTVKKSFTLLKVGSKYKLLS